MKYLKYVDVRISFKVWIILDKVFNASIKTFNAITLKIEVKIS